MGRKKKSTEKPSSKKSKQAKPKTIKTSEKPLVHAGDAAPRLPPQQLYPNVKVTHGKHRGRRYHEILKEA